MRIGELARRAGVNVETLRYYERRGLLAEPARGPNGHREDDEETGRFVMAVKEAQSLGVTLTGSGGGTRAGPAAAAGGSRSGAGLRRKSTRSPRSSRACSVCGTSS